VSFVGVWPFDPGIQIASVIMGSLRSLGQRESNLQNAIGASEIQRLRASNFSIVVRRHFIKQT
jgi:hypothetical protein